MGGRNSTVGKNLSSRAIGDPSAGVQDDNPFAQSASRVHVVGSRCAQCLSRPSVVVVGFDSEHPAVVMLPLRAALCTETTHDDVREAHMKTAPLLNSPLHLSKEVVIQVHALSA